MLDFLFNLCYNKLNKEKGVMYLSNTYDINSIESLTFKEGVRRRVQMYLGSDDIEGTYQALKEIINNSTDEALAGYGKRIELTVDEKDNRVSVRDYGRSVPFGIRENGENVLVSIYSQSHTGGKFSHDAYKNASGLNGVGGSCVCLSSLYFKVESYRDGKCARAEFKKGDLVSYKEEKTANKTGTYVEFIPDKEVFSNGEIGYSYDRICNDIQDISYLYPGIEFIVSNGTSTKTYCAKNGIVDFVLDNVKSPLQKHIITGSATDGTDSVEIAFQWGTKYETPYVFVNGLRCPELGTPATGAKTAITKTFNNLANENFDGEYIRKNMFYVINCKVENPSFANQTKSKINNASLRQLASTAFTAALKEMNIKYSTEFNTIVEMLRKVEKAERAADRARQSILTATNNIEKNQKKKVFSSDKLKDAEFLGQESTLLIVEGLSAASSMAVARDIKRYGILAIRGKLVNCLAHTEEKIFENEEINLLLSAMNIIPGKYNANKLRYGKIAICSDSDSDGFHIGLLIMAAIYKLAPQFLQENRLCWLRSPLYIEKIGKKEKYYFTDEEIKDVKITGELQRNKGLGSLSAEQAKNSMFNPENQRMDVLIPDAESLNLLAQLMGEDNSYRKTFIFENVDFSEIHE